MDAQTIIAALQLERAPSDTERAYVLEALASYANVTGLAGLREAALAARPAAHPLWPPKAWQDYYLDVFGTVADTECGVDPDEAPRYCQEFWAGLTDAGRQQRLAEPWLGKDDGVKDAEALNEA